MSGGTNILSGFCEFDAASIFLRHFTPRKLSGKALHGSTKIWPPSINSIRYPQLYHLLAHYMDKFIKIVNAGMLLYYLPNQGANFLCQCQECLVGALLELVYLRMECLGNGIMTVEIPCWGIVRPRIWICGKWWAWWALDGVDGYLQWVT